ncbi:MAG: sigma factor [Gammaproteobacteria bacterium]|nr:sigma factor [Gammaproteobacteria bacterium]
MRRIPTRELLLENTRIGDVCRKLLRMCRGENPEDARDLVQETWLKFIEKRRQVANEEAYLKKMIKNLLARLWRERHEREAALVALEEILERTAEASRNNLPFALAAEEPEELLPKAIARLPPRLRQAIELDTQGLSDEQIAVQLRIEITTVKKHLSRARARLASIMLQEAEHADE